MKEKRKYCVVFLVSGFSALSIGLGCGCSRRFVVQNVNKQIASSTDVFSYRIEICAGKKEKRKHVSCFLFYFCVNFKQKNKLNIEFFCVFFLCKNK